MVGKYLVSELQNIITASGVFGMVLYGQKDATLYWRFTDELPGGI